MDLNSINFEYICSNFSKRHMRCKDRNDVKTKAGCGRVVAAKEFGLVHAYTLECGYHCATEFRSIVNLNQYYRNSPWKYTQGDVSDWSSKLYVNGPPEFTPSIYENIGKQLLVSILDIFEWNPVSRIPHTEFKSLKQIRKVLA